jgi:hypothetical protein
MLGSFPPILSNIRGRECADDSHPGVYSRISYFYDWIVQSSCELSEKAPGYFHCEQVLAGNPDISSEPSAMPTQQPSSLPSSSPSFILSFVPTETDLLDFVAWSPPLPLQHCQGDCDNDSDCDGEMICFRRDIVNSEIPPGCEKLQGMMILRIADFCVYPPY